MKKLLIVIISLVFITGCSLEEKIDLNIVKHESQLIELVNYKNDDFEMRIPRGWLIESGGDNFNYALRIYDPNSNDIQMFVVLKNPDNSIQLKEPIIRSFFTNFNIYFENKYSDVNIPKLNDVEIIEEFNTHSVFEKTAIDDRSLRIKFFNNDISQEALVSATLVRIDNIYNVYNIFGIVCPSDELINYQKILSESISSIKFNDSFINKLSASNGVETEIKKNLNAIVKNLYSSYNTSWSYRQREYDYNTQREYDSNNNYIRVYDSKTGNIYKAYKDFMKKYHGSRYKRVSESMYADPVYGYIKE